MEKTELTHWGIKGMRWGRRRFQNKDGTLTPAGRERYYDADDMESYHKEREAAKRKERNKRILTAALTALATVGVVYGAKKYFDSKNSPAAAKGEDVVKELMNKAKASVKESVKKPKEVAKKPYVSPEISTKNLMRTVPGVKPLWEQKSNLPRTLDGGGIMSQKISDFMGGSGTTIGKPLWGGSSPFSKTQTKSTPKFNLQSDTEMAKKLAGRGWAHDGLEGGTTFEGESDDLSHWGIKGMKWGIRRFQNKDGSLTPEGKKRYGDGNELDEQALKDAKERAVKSGDPDRIRAYQSEMSNDELRKAIDRVKLHNDLRDYENKRNQAVEDRVKRASDKLGTIKQTADTAVGLWNVVAKINNTFNSKFKIPGISDEVLDFAKAYGKELDNATKKAKLDQEIAKARNENAKADQTEHNLRVQKEKYEKANK